VGVDSWGVDYGPIDPDPGQRTTISLDDRLAEQVRRTAARRGMSVSAFIARTLDDALKRPEPQHAVPFRRDRARIERHVRDGEGHGVRRLGHEDRLESRRRRPRGGPGAAAVQA
jgi:hypothetical protein